MKQKTLSLVQAPTQLIANVILGLALYYFGRYYAAFLPVVIALGFEAYRLGRQPAENWLELLISDSSLWLVTLSTALLVALLPRLVTQLVLVAALVGWRVWIELGTVRPIAQLAVAGITQFVTLWAIFLAQSVWHWPTILVLGLVWGSCWMVTRFVLAAYDDAAVSVLAVTWGLIAAECGWVFSLWQVQYILLNGWFIVPQAAIVLTALGYCLGGIYISHRRSELSRSRLLEYLMIGLALLAIVIAGTKWNGVI
jgi:hypothetical protein